MGKNSEKIKETYVTGQGELTGFICLQTPSTKYTDVGLYSAQILLSKDEGEKLAEKLNAIRAEQFKRYGKGTKNIDNEQCIPYVKEDGTPDSEGRYILKTKAKAYIKEGKPTYKVIIKNAKNQYINNVNIGAGSIARLVVSLEGYSVGGKTGTSVRLQTVQIIKLVEYGSQNDYDFDIVEGGYEGTGYSLGDGVKADESDEEVPF